MGNAKLRRAAFFANHPNCCFCGGQTPATQEDHLPARSLFSGRAWPEGYSFPACEPCNRGSADDELVLGWLVRIPIGKPTEEQLNEGIKAFRKLRDRQPEFANSIQLHDRADLRQHLRSKGRSLDFFKGVDLEMATLPPEAASISERYGCKLAKALYYLHVGHILSNKAFVRAHVYPNSTVMAADFNLGDFDLLRSVPIVSRSGKSLDDQFFYRFAVADEEGAAAFLASFGESMSIAMYVFEEGAAVDWEALNPASAQEA